MTLYPWLVFLHVLSAFGFLLAHGASTVVALRLRHERAPDRIRALLDASASSIPAMLVALLLVLVTGVALGFMGGWWRSGWIWASLALLILITVWMGWYGQRYYLPLRRAVGLPYRQGNKEMPAEAPLGGDEIDRLIRLTSPMTLLAGGMGGWAVILWLMMFKPL